MTRRLKLREIPPDFYDRFPDGDYTVGRGADPRGLPIEEQAADVANASSGGKTRKKPRRKPALPTAAE